MSVNKRRGMHIFRTIPSATCTTSAHFAILAVSSGIYISMQPYILYSPDAIFSQAKIEPDRNDSFIIYLPHNYPMEWDGMF